MGMRVIKLLLGIVSVAVGLGFIAGGAVAIQGFGTDGEVDLSSPTLEASKDARALVMDVANVDAGFPGSDQLGETTIGVQSKNFSSMFIGLASTANVDEYLSGVPYDVIRYENSRWETTSVPGTGEPSPPLDETFWTRRSTGTSPTVEFRKAPGPSTTFVVMNADTKPGIATAVRIGYRSSLIFPLALAAIVVGLVLIIIPILLAYLGRRRRAKQGRVSPAGSMPQSPVVATPAPADRTEQVSPQPATQGDESPPPPPPKDAGGEMTDPPEATDAKTPGTSDLDDWFRNDDKGAN